MDIHTRIGMVQQTQPLAEARPLEKPRITRQLDCEVEMDLIEDFMHFTFHKHDLHYKREYFVAELEKAMRAHMYLNKDLRSQEVKDKILMDRIDSLLNNNNNNTSSSAPPTPTYLPTRTKRTKTTIDSFI